MSRALPLESSGSLSFSGHLGLPRPPSPSWPQSNVLDGKPTPFPSLFIGLGKWYSSLFCAAWRTSYLCLPPPFSLYIGVKISPLKVRNAPLWGLHRVRLPSFHNSNPGREDNRMFSCRYCICILLSHVLTYDNVITYMSWNTEKKQIYSNSFVICNTKLKIKQYVKYLDHYIYFVYLYNTYTINTFVKQILGFFFLPFRKTLHSALLRDTETSDICLLGNYFRN